MKLMDNDTIAMWTWAMEHPLLYTVIEVSTPALLLAFIAGKLITALSDISLKNKRSR